MKKVLAVSLVLAAGFAGLTADEIPDLSEFTPLQAESGPVFFEDFNKGLDDWKGSQSDHFTYCASEGLMGTGCLMAQRKKGDKPIEIQREVQLKHGVLYKLTFRYRSEMVPVDPANPNKKGVLALSCIRFRNTQTGKIDHGSFKTRSELSRPEWTEWDQHFRVPEGYDSKVVLGLLIHVDRAGKVWYEDVSIEEAEKLGCTVFPVRNNVMTYDPEAGITWFVNFPAGFPKSEYKLLAEVGGVKKLLELSGSYAHGLFGAFPEGRLPVKATLLDMTNKQIMGSDESVLFVRNVENIPGSIVMDEQGRMTRNGKPFLPVGVFVGHNDLKDTQTLQRIKDAGFNSILMNFSSVNFAGKKDSARETLVEGVREMAKYDLGLLCGVKYQLPFSSGKIEKFDNVTGLDNVTRCVIESLRCEPNMVGYYISDENPVTEVPAIRKLRELVGELDPWHPTMTLTCRVDDFPAFAKTGDYLMYDDYPVGCGWYGFMDSERQSMKSSHKNIRKAKEAGIPFVWVPQIFSWNTCVKGWPHRYPTSKELRSIALLGAVYEARAYYCYAYHIIFYRDPDYAEEAWKNTAEGVKLISSLAPWFLSTEPAPEAQVKQISGAEVAARAFVHEGKPLVIITADGPDECEAEITVPGVTGLKSRYGNTEEVSPGVYKFKGLNIDSDVLSAE